MFKITLQAVRISLGYKIEEAANHCHVSTQEMERLENDLGDMPASMVIKLRKLYGFPIDYVSI